MLKAYLKQLDLDDKESEAYLALLGLGETQIMPLTSKVSMPRTTLADVLERLQEKGLIEILNQGGSRKLYIPKSPKAIKDLLAEKKSQIENKLEALDKVLPDLLQQYGNSAFQPKVRLYQGLDIRKIYEELLSPTIKEYWFISEPVTVGNFLGKRWFRNWINRRVQQGTKSFGLRAESAEIKEEEIISSSSEKYLREIRYLPNEFRSPASVIIYGNSVAIITTAKENFGIVIDSKDYMETMKSWFDALWRISRQNIKDNLN